MHLGYDDSNPLDIERYSKKLIGHSFKEVISWDNQQDCEWMVKEEVESYGNKSRKGGVGNLLEEKYFHYKANSDSNPDFPKAGVELKTSPYEIKRDGTLRAGERLSLHMISYEKPIDLDLYNSHLWHKCKLLLLIYYLRNREFNDKLDNIIKFATLFTPTGADLKIIEQDYQKIAEKIASGNAHELSEGDTTYLGASTKGRNAEKSTVKQFYPPHLPARKRSFCYKQSYMTYVLNNYIVKNIATYKGKTKSKKKSLEPIIKDESVLDGVSFDDLVVSKINRFVGKTDMELCDLFRVPYTGNKAQWVSLAYRMLGVKSNQAEEFVKAGIKVKTIRIEADGKIEQHMSFPTFKYKEIIEEEWEESTINTYFGDTRFLFVVYKKVGENYVLKGCQFWNMPYSDLESVVKKFWYKVVSIIKIGVSLQVVKNRDGSVRVLNNFPGVSDNGITHIRPHASKRYFEFTDGTIIGEKKYKVYANELPDGTWMPNYCFWLNNSYILNQINDDLK